MRVNLCRAVLLGAIAALVPLAPSDVCAQARMEVEAIAGQPFGVGRITMLAEPVSAPGILELPLLTDEDERALYPAYESEPLRRLLRDLLAAPRRTTVYFLFQGDAPLRLTFYAPATYTRTVVPQPDRGGDYERLLFSWWRAYAGPRSKLADDNDPAGQIHAYLAATLSRRLRLNPPESLLAQQRGVGQTALDLLAGSESLRIDLVTRELLADRQQVPVADQPLPDPPSREALTFPEERRKIEVEPIALRVPEECLYLRFGSFPNFQWFQHRLDDWGGDLRNLIAERGVSFGLHDRLENQIALHENILANLLGERVIADVAVIGTDTFLREGAAMGVLFLARNSGGLAADISRQRSDALAKIKGAKEEKLRIADHDVSLISTPDNALRSFYVVDGDYHFVTTSRTLARRFLETAKDKRSLGRLAEFRHARTLIPADRGDTVFIYLSTAFFGNLLGPHYRIESMRRTQSIGEIEAVQLARLAARAEHRPGKTIEDLIAADVLPTHFGRHPDGSRIVLGRGEPYDTHRGPRGNFVPVPDMPVKGVTRAEAAAYRPYAEFLESQIGTVEPVLVGVRRKPAGKGLEHVMLDIKAAPLSSRRHEQISGWLGPPTDQRIRQAEGDLLHAQVSISGGRPLAGPPHQLFGALRDGGPEGPTRAPGILGMLMGPQNFRGYVGAWPHPGLLRWIGGTSNIPSDDAGFTQLRTGLWRRQWGQFTALSFHPDVLEEVTPQLRFDRTPHPAQLWAHGVDLTGTQLAETINRWGYQYEGRISDGNAEFMHYLQEQLHVPVERCLTIAETILHARLVCPLAGRYEVVTGRGFAPSWRSTALRDPRGDAPPEKYTFPALKWLRGLDGEVRFDQSVLSLHADLVMPAEAGGFSLPTFGFPSLFPGPKK